MRAKVRRIQFCHAFIVHFLVVREGWKSVFGLPCPVMSDRYMLRLLGAGGLDVAGLLAAVAHALLGDLGGAVAGQVTGLTA